MIDHQLVKRKTAAREVASLLEVPAVRVLHIWHPGWAAAGTHSWQQGWPPAGLWPWHKGPPQKPEGPPEQLFATAILSAGHSQQLPACINKSWFTDLNVSEICECWHMPAGLWSWHRGPPQKPEGPPEQLFPTATLSTSHSRQQPACIMIDIFCTSCHVCHCISLLADACCASMRQSAGWHVGLWALQPYSMRFLCMR